MIIKTIQPWNIKMLLTTKFSTKQLKLTNKLTKQTKFQMSSFSWVRTKDSKKVKYRNQTIDDLVIVTCDTMHNG